MSITRWLTVTLVVAFVALVALVASGCDSSTTELDVNIVGAGHVVSGSGLIDCRADGDGGMNGTCSLTTDTPVDVHLLAIPDDGNVIDGISFGVSVDCNACNSGDPPAGSIDVHGDRADVRVDIQSGFSNVETVGVVFVRAPPPAPVAAPPASP